MRDCGGLYIAIIAKKRRILIFRWKMSQKGNQQSQISSPALTTENRELRSENWFSPKTASPAIKACVQEKEPAFLVRTSSQISVPGSQLLIWRGKLPYARGLHLGPDGPSGPLDAGSTIFGVGLPCRRLVTPNQRHDVSETGRFSWSIGPLAVLLLHLQCSLPAKFTVKAVPLGF